MSAHTPAPWEVVRHNHIDGELWLSVNQCADADGMKEWIAEIKYLTTNRERQCANARLIAAAPEMLEALKALVLKTERCDNPGDEGVGRDADEMVAARAAILKAGQG